MNYYSLACIDGVGRFEKIVQLLLRLQLQLQLLLLPAKEEMPEEAASAIIASTNNEHEEDNEDDDNEDVVDGDSNNIPVFDLSKPGENLRQKRYCMESG